MNTQPQDIPPGGTFTFNCTPVSSNSRANVTFKLNSSDISDSNVHITGYVLTIPSVQRSQRGMYSCVVTNRLNATSASIEVNVIGELYSECSLRVAGLILLPISSPQLHPLYHEVSRSPTLNLSPPLSLGVHQRTMEGTSILQHTGSI